MTHSKTGVSPPPGIRAQILSCLETEDSQGLLSLLDLRINGSRWHKIVESVDCNLQPLRDLVAEGEAQATTIQQLTEQNAALTAQLKSTGHAPYLERMKELADKRDAAEQALTVLRGALLNELQEKEHLTRVDIQRLFDRTGSTAQR